MQPGNYPLAVRQGDTLRLTITLANPVPGQSTPGTPIDLTGAEAQLLIRKALQTTALQLKVTSAAPTTNGSSLTLGGAAGTIAVVLASADTDPLQTGAYDLRVRFADGTTQTYLTGAFTVSGEAESWAAAQ